MFEGFFQPGTGRVTQKTIRTRWIVVGAVVALLGGILIYLALNE